MKSAADPALTPLNDALLAAKSEAGSDETEVKATVSRVLYSADDGYSLLLAVRGGKELKVAGTLPQPETYIGCDLVFMGSWRDAGIWGKQFRFSSAIQSEPQSRAALAAYLRRNAPGIGPAKASKLWENFGAESVEALKNRVDEIVAMGLLSDDAAKRASAKLKSIEKVEHASIALFGMLHGHGFPNRTVSDAITHWGERAPAMIKRNAYCLIKAKGQFPGVGFKLADKLYLALGGNARSLKRQALAAIHEMKQAGSGSSWFLRHAINRAVILAVGNSLARPDRAVTYGLRAKLFQTQTDKQGQQWITETSRAVAERTLAWAITKMLKNREVLWPRGPFGLSDHQEEQIRSAIHSSIFILAGTPGTGKTYTAAAVLKQVVEVFGRDAVCVVAPTGKAAVRITEAMQRAGLNLQATTIHRALAITGDGGEFTFGVNERNPLPYRFVAVEESSMLDTALAASLFSAMAPTTHVMLIGDPYQLPPVSPGAPLRDLLRTQVPVAMLTEVQRNSGMIVRACSSIKDGRPPEMASTFSPDQNLVLAEAATPASQIEILLQFVDAIQRSNRDAFEDLQVITPLNRTGELSRVALNELLQAKLNPANPETPSHLVHRQFRIGDKVICLANQMAPLVSLSFNKDAADPRSYVASSTEKTLVANGDMGRVVACSPDAVVTEFRAPSRLVRFTASRTKQERSAEADRLEEQRESAGETSGSAEDLALGYAITVHKAQGSEAPIVVYMIDPAATKVASRELVYTALSRPTQRGLAIGLRRILLSQMGRVAINDRKTFLAEIIQEEP